MKALVLLNAAAGTLAANGTSDHRSVAYALAAAGIDADIQLVAGPQLQAAARAAADSQVDVVIVGGGDGTLSSVAGALAGTPMPLGILPLGTLNHFAKDLGIPFDLTEAARVIAANHVGGVDVGEVNGRVFINNSSLGVYPHMVLDREDQRKRFGVGKWWAMCVAVFKTFRRFPLVQVRLTINGESVVRKTPLVFIGNNCYQLDLFRIGTRACLDRGELSLYVANAQTRWGMLKLTLRGLFGGLQQARDFETSCLVDCVIESRRRRIHVAADGEVFETAFPLRYRVRAGELGVCLPQKPPVNV